MTVSSTTNRVTYAGNGSTTNFAIPFYFLANAHILAKKVNTITLVETTLALTTDYTLTGAGALAGGELAMLTAPATGEQLVIIRDPDFKQETDYRTNDKFPAETHERALDKLTMLALRLLDKLGLTLSRPDSAVDLNYNAGGRQIDNLADGTEEDHASTVGQIEDYVDQVVQGGTSIAPKKWNLTGDGVTTTFPIAGADVATALAYDVRIAGVGQDPGVDFTISLSGTPSIIFTSAPPVTDVDKIVVVLRGFAKGAQSDAAQLRTDLSSSGGAYGADLVANAVRYVTTAAGLRGMGAALKANTVYVSNTTGASDGGVFYRDASDTTSAEDGGIYAGTVIRPADYATRGVFKRVTDIVSVNDFGAVGNGSTPVAAAYLRAATALSAAGGGELAFDKSAAGYLLDRPYASSQRGLSVLPKVNIDGNNARLTLSNNNEFFYLGRPQDRSDTTFVSFYGVTAGVDYAQIPTSAVIAANTTAIPVTAGDETAFVAGDLVYVRLGQESYDSAENDWGYFAEVVSTSSGIVNLDRQAGYAITMSRTPTGDVTSGSSTITNVSATTGITRWMTISGSGIPANTFVGDVTTTTIGLINSSGVAVNATASNVGTTITAQVPTRQRRIIKVTGMPENVEISNFELYNPTTGSANSEGGFHYRYARNIKISNVRATNVGPGVIVGQFGENIEIDNVALDGCDAQGQASKGRMFSIAETKNFKCSNYRAENFDNVLAFIEGWSENVVFENGLVVNNAAGHAATDEIFFLAGARDLRVDGLKLEGSPSTILGVSDTDKLKLPVLFNVEASPSFAPAYGSVAQWFEVDHVGENVKMGNWFHFRQKRRYTAEVELQPSITDTQILALPKGAITKITVTLNSKTGVTALYLTDDGFAFHVPSPNTSAVTALTANVPFVFPKTSIYPWWSFGSNHGFANPSLNKILVATTGSTLVAGTKAFIEIEYFPTTTPTILNDIVVSRVVRSTFSGGKTHDWPSLASGAQQSTTVTCTGARLGDFAQASFSSSLAGTVLIAEVSAADTVTVTQINNTGAPVDLASGTLRVRSNRS